jgi:hypothetical protein
LSLVKRLQRPWDFEEKNNPSSPIAKAHPFSFFSDAVRRQLQLLMGLEEVMLPELK